MEMFHTNDNCCIPGTFNRFAAIGAMCTILPALKMLPPSFLANTSDEIIELMFNAFKDTGISQYRKTNRLMPSKDGAKDFLKLWFSGNLTDNDKLSYEFEISVSSINTSRDEISNVTIDVDVVKKDTDESFLIMDGWFEEFVKVYENSTIHANLSTKCHSAISIAGRVEKSADKWSIRIVYTVPIVNRDRDSYLCETFLSGSIPLIVVYLVTSLKTAFDKLVLKKNMQDEEINSSAKESNEKSSEVTSDEDVMSNIDYAFNKYEASKNKLDDVIDEIDALLNKLDSQSHTSSNDEYDE